MRSVPLKDESYDAEAGHEWPCTTTAKCANNKTAARLSVMVAVVRRHKLFDRGCVSEPAQTTESGSIVAL